jgi:hypothetical protein
MARSIAAFTTLAGGDSTRALAQLKALVDEPVPGSDLAWDLAAPRGAERLTLARLFAAKKDYRKAIDVANVFDASWPVIYLLYLSPSLELREAAARSAGESDMAARFKGRFDALHSGPVVAGK